MTYDPYRRAKPGEPRCQEMQPFPSERPALRCEYRVHKGHAHAALDGSVMWLDRESPVFDDEGSGTYGTDNTEGTR